MHARIVGAVPEPKSYNAHMAGTAAGDAESRSGRIVPLQRYLHQQAAFRKWR
jgi:hypothetical protein